MCCFIFVETTKTSCIQQCSTLVSFFVLLASPSKQDPPYSPSYFSSGFAVVETQLFFFVFRSDLALENISLEPNTILFLLLCLHRKTTKAKVYSVAFRAGLFFTSHCRCSKTHFTLRSFSSGFGFIQTFSLSNSTAKLKMAKPPLKSYGNTFMETPSWKHLHGYTFIETPS